MGQVGFITDKLEIKLLILYIASRLVGPAPFEMLQDLSMCDEGVDYFGFSECLADLLRTEHLAIDEDDRYVVLPYFWIPEDCLELRVRRDHVPYDLWERQEYLQTTEGNVIHYGYIEKFIERLGEKYNIREIAFDRWGAVQMVQNLEGMGFTVVPFGQGFKDMSPPTKELMNLVLGEKIAHGEQLRSRERKHSAVRNQSGEKESPRRGDLCLPAWCLHEV